MSGFDVVRAVKHVREGHGSAPPPPKKPPRAPPGKPPDDPGDSGGRARIGKTAIPTKYEYVCYECGYRFTIAGKVRTLYCAKCRTVLNQADYTIDDRHDVSIVTAGTVRITPQGTWAGGTLTARDVILEGTHEGGSIKACHRLEIAPGAVFNLAGLEAEDLLVQDGAEIRTEGPVAFRNVILKGIMDAELEASGLVSIHAGGHFKGKLVAGHLNMEDGGGLTAEVRLEPHKQKTPVEEAP